MTKPNIMKCNLHKLRAMLPCLPLWKSCNNLCMGCSEGFHILYSIKMNVHEHWMRVTCSKPLTSFCIHTQKRKQLSSIPWRTSTQRKAVDTHIQKKKQLPCTQKRTIGYHADTVNNKLPSSHREKRSCHMPTHTQAYTIHPKKNKQRRTSI